MRERKVAPSDTFSSANMRFSADAHADLKKVLKAWKSLKPLQSSGLLSA
jgi:hypothetical protein